MTPCTKTAYAKRSDARKILHAMGRRLNAGKVRDTQKYYQGTLQVYKCPKCKKFHIGHRRRKD
jgi:hypothetical protein